ncbi:hypothetical protein [Levilinea saccharolytica]|nr:hypothetical protein [Levilinea saccharolytica]
MSLNREGAKGAKEGREEALFHRTQQTAPPWHVIANAIDHRRGTAVFT